MGAPEGNSFWKLRAKSGRDAIFTKPQVLLDSCYEYFKATSERKWNKQELIRGGDLAGQIIGVPTDTPYTISGLCIFLGVNTKYLTHFKDSDVYKDNKDFSTIITHVEEIIETQQLEGAIVGSFNPNIIARKLGLVDKSEQKVTQTPPLLPDISNSGNE